MMTKLILLVEDDENDVFFFQRAMNSAGMLNPIQVANDGQTAIEYLQGTGKFADRATFPLPGLILLDLKLPFVTGLDVLKWIHQQPGLEPIVVILSSSQEERDIAAAYRLGAKAYLVKPVEPSKLQGMVRAINDFWLMQNTPPPITCFQRGSVLAAIGRPAISGATLSHYPSQANI
jgi:two-component system response regulator